MEFLVPLLVILSILLVSITLIGHGIWVTLAQEAQLRELESTLRQLERLHQAGALDGVNLRVLKTKIDSEREQLLFPHGRPGVARQPSLFTPDLSAPRAPRVAPPIKQDDGPARPAVRSEPEQTGPSPFAVPATPQTTSPVGAAPQFGAWAKDSDEPVHSAPVLKPPRKPFAEVLA